MFEDLKPPAPDAPGEEEYRKLLSDLQSGNADLPTRIERDVVARMLISQRQLQGEANQHRLEEVMKSFGYRWNDDPEHPFFEKM